MEALRKGRAKNPAKQPLHLLVASVKAAGMSGRMGQLRTIMKPSIVTCLVATLGALALGPSGLARADSTNAAKLPARSFLTMGGVATTPEKKASLRFGGKELPMPPQQTTPWSALPSSLPTNYVSATAVLFEAGMADPRGCD